MATVKELKARGFKVAPAQEAVGCTEVRSARRFQYVNPRFVDDELDFVRRIADPEVIEGGYRLIVANQFGDDDEFPFILLSEEEIVAISKAHEEVLSAQAACNAAIRKVEWAKKALSSLVANQS